MIDTVERQTQYPLDQVVVEQQPAHLWSATPLLGADTRKLGLDEAGMSADCFMVLGLPESGVVAGYLVNSRTALGAVCLANAANSINVNGDTTGQKDDRMKPALRATIMRGVYGGYDEPTLIGLSPNTGLWSAHDGLEPTLNALALPYAVYNVPPAIQDITLPSIEKSFWVPPQDGPQSLDTLELVDEQWSEEELASMLSAFADANSVQVAAIAAREEGSVLPEWPKKQREFSFGWIPGVSVPRRVTNLLRLAREISSGDRALPDRGGWRDADSIRAIGDSKKD